MTGQNIHIVDRVELEPGRAREFVTAYLADYAPRAVEIGMTLDGVLLSPPLWLDDDTNTVTATWTVRGHAEWWRTAIARRFDAAFTGFWDDVAPLISSRSRSMAANVDDVDGLCRV
jgi:hypothetical protein